MEVEANIDDVWNDIKAHFCLDEFRDSISRDLQKTSVHFLISENLHVGVLEYLQAEVEKRLRVEVAPAFWNHFKRQRLSKESEENDLANSFQIAVNELSVATASVLPLVTKMDKLAIRCNLKVNQYGLKSYQDIFWLFLKGTLYSQLPNCDYRSPIKAFYGRAFHVHHIARYGTNPNDSMEQDDDDLDENIQCEGCKKDKSPNHCICNNIKANFNDVNKKLMEIKLLDRLTGDIVTSLVREKIEKHVSDTCNGSFTSSYIKSLENWLKDVVINWIRLIYSAQIDGINCSDEVNVTLKSFEQRLSHFLFETYTKARIDQLFNIIIEFPESQPAVDDLKQCLERTDLRPHLTIKLKNVLEKKLLHLGVNTTDILTGYIAAIRALRVLDPSGVLLEIVCEPVRKYLR